MDRQRPRSSSPGSTRFLFNWVIVPLLVVGSAVAVGALVYAVLCFFIPLLGLLFGGTFLGPLLGLVVLIFDRSVAFLLLVASVLLCILPQPLRAWLQLAVWALLASKLFWAVVAGVVTLLVHLLAIRLNSSVVARGRVFTEEEEEADIGQG